MIIKNTIKKNTYYDSATLMLLSNQMAQEIGAENVAVMMATPANKEILQSSGLLAQEGETAGPNDLIFAAKGASDEIIEQTFATAETHLHSRSDILAKENVNIVKTFESALQKVPELNLAVISVPGKYAKREALKALNAGVHVLLFSDNVSLEDEIELKEKAQDKGLLMMGPDCGTAVINGVALGFANVIAPGNIGIVAAAGTGLQEVATIISKHGGGISQAIGTGGRDVKEAVGGRMMLAGIKALAEDRNTDVIVLVSKPPAQSVLEKILGTVATLDKPVVTCFLGDETAVSQNERLFAARTLEEAAIAAVSLSKGEQPHAGSGSYSAEQFQPILAAETARFQASQHYIRGLYTGGTLCYEAMMIAADSLSDIYSNTPVRPQQTLKDPLKSQGHTFIDLGEDEFTRGRPHPMIEPALRNERILAESHDPEVAVVLLDVVLGYGAHDDPAGVAASAVVLAKQQAEQAGRYLSVVASVCGTSQDPQHLETQIETLQQAGVLVMPSNAQAVKLAIRLVNRQKGE